MVNKAPLLEIKNLRVHYKVYGGVLKVLDGVNLTVYPGEKVGLVGETGCGKTTTMKTALAILPVPPGVVVGGEILYKGRNLLAMSPRQLSNVRGREMTMIFQDPMAALNPVFNVEQQFTPVLKHAAKNHLSNKEIHAQAVLALQDVALADPERLLQAYPIQLSGGMRQRVCIGMALATRPQLLIADEPGTALDVTIQAQVLRLLNNLVDRLNTSIILITHSLGVVYETVDRLYVMYAGNIVEVAPTRKLFSNPLHPYSQGLMDAVPKLSGGGISQGISGRIPDYSHPPAGCRFHTRCSHVMEICRHQKPPEFEVEEGHKVACYLYGPKNQEAAV
ncbi:MAG: ABC transporter ATP-binding protein [Anaerolineales bacterium]|nr:ABC transporter ATP-binding protein [Anaerolineales bacterium]